MARLPRPGRAGTKEGDRGRCRAGALVSRKRALMPASPCHRANTGNTGRAQATATTGNTTAGMRTTLSFLRQSFGISGRDEAKAMILRRSSGKVAAVSCGVFGDRGNGEIPGRCSRRGGRCMAARYRAIDQLPVNQDRNRIADWLRRWGRGRAGGPPPRRDPPDPGGSTCRSRRREDRVVGALDIEKALTAWRERPRAGAARRGEIRGYLATSTEVNLLADHIVDAAARRRQRRERVDAAKAFPSAHVRGEFTCLGAPATPRGGRELRRASSLEPFRLLGWRSPRTARTIGEERMRGWCRRPAICP